jgi:endonuclease/exonuclease/phosphatase (EEP) superfamily protein YafD
MAGPLPESPDPTLTLEFRRRSRTGTIVTWLLVVPGVVWALARLFGLERGSPAVQLMAFTPYAAALSLVPLGIALLARRWWAAGVAGLVCVALAACVLPRTVGSDSTVVGFELRVMSANLLVGGADAATIVGLVRDQRVDVLAVQELTPEVQARMDAAGLAALLPYRANVGVQGSRGSGLYARWPIADPRLTENPSGFRQASGVIELPGGGRVAVESVHPAPPAGRVAIPDWTAELRNPTPANAGPAGLARILAGDFNATLDHRELRRLIDTGYRDAAAAVGAGLTPTWPYAGPLRTAPGVTIDHVLVSGGIGVRGFQAYPVPGSDHRAILATLVVPP